MKFFHKNNKSVSDMMSMIEILINENLKLQLFFIFKKTNLFIYINNYI